MDYRRHTFCMHVLTETVAADAADLQDMGANRNRVMFMAGGRKMLC